MPNRTTIINTITKFTLERYNKIKCRCGNEFKIGDKVVTKRNNGNCIPRHYHIEHYTDAHGEPLFE